MSPLRDTFLPIFPSLLLIISFEMGKTNEKEGLFVKDCVPDVPLQGENNEAIIWSQTLFTSLDHVGLEEVTESHFYECFKIAFPDGDFWIILCEISNLGMSFERDRKRGGPFNI